MLHHEGMLDRRTGVKQIDRVIMSRYPGPLVTRHLACAPVCRPIGVRSFVRHAVVQPFAPKAARQQNTGNTVQAGAHETARQVHAKAREESRGVNFEKTGAGFLPATSPTSGVWGPRRTSRSPYSGPMA
jgi:hypothetical protein